MFGYVKVHAAELRLREYELYRAYYCGLCRAMGKCTGQCSRLSLSYDATFLALIRCSLTGEKPCLEKFHCPVHPFRKRKAVKRSPQLSYCADASALLVYHKIVDDKHDEKGLKKCRAWLAGLFFRKSYRLAKKRHPGLDAAILASLSELRSLEGSEEYHPPEEYAAVSAKMLEAIFSDGLDGSRKKIASALGSAIGKWIYLTDAADDFSDDRKKHRFNPLIRRFGESLSPDNLSELRESLMNILCEAEPAYGLIDFPADVPELKELTSNILYWTLPMTTEKITAGSVTNKKGQL